MKRRTFVVLWICWLALVAVPVGAMGVYARFTEGLNAETLLMTASLIWIPFFILLALQYIVIGHSSIPRLWLDDPP